jgi:cyclomaltodextrinase / maltogenic alpha-amylase / neopullulanase
MKRLIALCLFIATFTSLTVAQVNVPAWAKDAIWYQIFPERYRNDDPSNDPTPAELEMPPNREWHVSPWTSDWYKLQPWEKAHSPNFYDNVFDRRYGGDLQGVIDKLDYLKDLGITAVYFNPVFEAFSLHKYDASSYHHIDNNFGPDSKGDLELMKTETDDPKTWHWTAADKLFLKLIQEAHKRGIKVIIDGVFNHSGTRFFAFEDVVKNQKQSRYADWYDVTSWADSSVPGSKFAYKSWWNTQTLPEFKEGPHSFAKPVWDYFFNITRRWMDPNGDGDPSDGIDGWRLDVANDVSHVFWKGWRKFVKSINPNAYIVGEIWDDASPWLKGDEFDAVMNYPFATACMKYFIDTDKRKYTTSAFDQKLADIRSSYPQDVDYVMQNLLDSHDTDRLLSMIANPNRHFNDSNRPQNNPDYDISKPGADATKVMKLMVLFQMTYLGAPMIYYGDEAGMWGAGDPDDRKPMVWPDLKYDNEATDPIPGRSRSNDVVAFDSSLFDYYKKVIEIRKENVALREGTFQTVSTPRAANVYAFERETADNSVLVVLNNSNRTESVTLPLNTKATYRDVMNGNQEFSTNDGTLTLRLDARAGRVLVKNGE